MQYFVKSKAPLIMEAKDMECTVYLVCFVF